MSTTQRNGERSSTNDATERADAPEVKGKLAFLLIALGGSAFRALAPLIKLFQNDLTAPPRTIVYADTQRGNQGAGYKKIDFGLTAEDLAIVKDNPSSIGPVASMIRSDHPKLLSIHSAEVGSCTNRLLSQLGVEVNLWNLINQLRASIAELKVKYAVRQIQPILFGSSGGGSGSSSVPQFAKILHDDATRSEILAGHNPHLLLPPVAVLVEPFAYADLNSRQQARRILGNAYATRYELSMMSDIFRYAFHIGLANDGGIVLDRPEEISLVLGECVYQLVVNWDDIMARLVDVAGDQRSGAFQTDGVE